MPLKVLHADDESGWREIVSRQLNGDGHLVVSVNSGEELLEAFLRQDFDVVITDGSMGWRKLTGLDVLTRIRKGSKHADIPVIVLSGDDRLAPYVKSGGVFAYKGNGLEDLLPVLKELEMPPT